MAATKTLPVSVPFSAPYIPTNGGQSLTVHHDDFGVLNLNSMFDTTSAIHVDAAGAAPASTPIDAFQFLLDPHGNNADDKNDVYNGVDDVRNNPDGAGDGPAAGGGGIADLAFPASPSIPPATSLRDRRRLLPLQVSFSTPSGTHFGSAASNIRGSRDDGHPGGGNSKSNANGSQPLRPTSSNGSVNSENKPKLPSIAAMSSPQAGDYGWYNNANSVDMHNSLRAGPLSPAMLAGPAGYGKTGLTPGGDRGMLNGFDPNTMRTGLTPDVGRTGLTPYITGAAGHHNLAFQNQLGGGGGGSHGGIPPASPNTAALIAMVTNQQGGGGGNGNSGSAGLGMGAGAASNQPGGPLGPITPNTLTAITNAMMSVENSHAGGNGGNPHPLSMSHLPHHDDDPAHTAANGLFLLSQAHHELTKREQEHSGSDGGHRGGGTHNRSNSMNDDSESVASSSNRGGNAQSGGKGGRGAGQKGATKKKAGGGAGSKRKSTNANQAEADAPPANKRSKSTKNASAGAPKRRGSTKKAPSPPPMSDSDEDGNGMDMDDDDEENQLGSDDDELGAGKSQNGGKGKKFESEEDKRKNFLERNRQAALKCRQRKKAWLNQLQAKVEYLTAENERLANTTVSMREEISRLSAVVVAHRDCGLSGVSVERSEKLIASTQNVKGIAGGPIVGAPHVSVLGSPAGNHIGQQQKTASDSPHGSPMIASSNVGQNHKQNDTVSSNVPAANSRRNANTDSPNPAPMTTRTRASARNSSGNNVTGSDSPISNSPQLVTAGGGGKRYGY